MALVELNKDNLAEFLENFVDSGIKAVDTLDLFKDDGFFASAPYGKLVNYFAKKIIRIDDPNEALRKSVALAHASNLLEGTKKFNFQIKISSEQFSAKLKIAKDALLNFNVEVKNFDIDNFQENELIKFYSLHLEQLFSNSFTYNQTIKLAQYRKDYLKLDFLRILDSHKTVYENLTVLLKNESYDEFVHIFRKKKYQEDLKNQFNDLVLNDQEGMTLADIYIEPKFGIHQYCLQKQENEHHNFVSIFQDSIHDFIHQCIESNSHKAIFRHEKNNLYFILGYPGQGKSSFCKKFVFDVYAGVRPISKEVHLIRIRNITDTVNLISNPIQTLYDHWLSENDMTEKDLKKQNFRESILVLDGLDELFMKANLPAKAIDEFCRVIARETESSPLLNIIITSRFGYIDLERLKNAEAIIIQLQEFEVEQQITWLGKFKAFHPETNLNAEKLTSYNINENYKPIRELITQPILLHLIATLNQDVTVDMNRALIYDRLFTELIRRKWAAEGQIDALKGLEEDDLREFLRDIAFAIAKTGREYIHKSTLINLPETKRFINKLDQKEHIQDVLKNIMIAFYFQETKKKADDNEDDRHDFAIEFLHKSLQEYLVAEKIWEEMQAFVATDSRKGKFIIDDARTGLEKLTEIFRDIEIFSSEIEDSIKGIIKNTDLQNRKILSDRCKLFLPEWFNKGFLLGFEWGEHYLTFEDRIFTNFWTILINLIEKEDYLGSIQDLSYFSGKVGMGVQMNSQKFIGKDNDNDYHYYLTSSSIELIIDKEENSIEFIDYGIGSCVFNDLTYANFVRCRIYGSTLFSSEKITFNNCILSSTNIYGSTVELKKTVFDRCHFYEGSLLSFEECKITNCTFYVYEDLKENFFDGNELINCAFIKVEKMTYPIEIQDK